VGDGPLFVQGSIHVEYNEWLFQFLYRELVFSGEILVHEGSSSARVDEGFCFNGFSIARDLNGNVHSFIRDLS